MNHYQSQPAEHVHQDVSLPPVDQLAGVKPALRAAPIRGLARLAVEEGRGRLPLAPFLLWRQVAQAIVDSLPNACDSPSAEVARDGFPGRRLAGQGTPLAARTVDVKDRVHGQAQIGLTLPATGF